MAKSKPTEEPKGVSRRKLIQSAAAVTMVAAIHTVSAKGTEARNKAAAFNEKIDSPSYRALALWLTLTTNPKQFFNDHTPDEIDVRLQVTKGSAKSFHDKFTGVTPLPIIPKTYGDMYELVKSDFKDVAGAAPYSGGQCPKNVETIGAIADLYKP
jgi:hypothetical protein